MSSLQLRLNKLIKFIEVDIWKIRLADLPKSKSTLYHNLRIAIITVKDFIDDNCPLKASALTYLSILSIVPVAAALFGIAKGFGLEIDLQKELANILAGQEMVVNETFKYAQNMLDSARGGVIAGISLGFLFYTVIRLFHNIEMAFNDIWAIKKQRSLVRKVTDYLAIVIVSPILLVVSSSMTVYISTQLDTLVQRFEVLDHILPLIQFGLRLVPLILICLMFSLFFVIMPFTRVKLKSALFAGIITGIAFQLLQYAYIEFQVGVSRYNAIYGSLAALPLFFIWVQLSWTIVLFGAEFAFAHQNANRYYFEDGKTKLSPSRRRMLALLVMTAIVKNFERGEQPLTDIQIADRIGVPVRFVILLISELKEAGLILETDVDDEEGYLPSIDIHKISIHYVIDKLEKQGLNKLSIGELEEVKNLEDALSQFQQAAKESTSNKLLVNL